VVKPVCALSCGAGVYEIADGLFQAPGPDTPEDWDALWGLAAVIVGLDHPDNRTPLSVPISKMLVKWPIEDGPLPDLDVLRPLAELLARLMEAGLRVAVFCGAGSNRAGLVCALVARELSGASGRRAADHVRALRPGALINGTFNAYLHALPRLEEEFYHEAREPERAAEIGGLLSPGEGD
jgi:hypothetical protein